MQRAFLAPQMPFTGKHSVWQAADLRKKMEEEQRMLMQWAEERLALAQSLLGLLELHVTQANKDIAAFDSELQVRTAPAALLLPLMFVQTTLACTDHP